MLERERNPCASRRSAPFRGAPLRSRVLVYAGGTLVSIGDVRSTALERFHPRARIDWII